MYAAQDGQLKAVELLLSLGADPNTSVAGATALNYASSNHRRDISILLLNRGADPNTRPAGYDSPLAASILALDKLLFDALIAKGAITNDPTALQAALNGCSRGGWDPSYARFLLEKSPELKRASGLGGAIAATSLKLCPSF